ncbi:putative lipoprotein [Hydrogenophaga sp. RAC07]|uniref:hypothetical protein n=1 Tax=Hydrogenophaga sp. RAC07 TaxID=1842537 RepID=UPI000856B699|nr:hypothetical protein [Hydrogenophaga sp. RAC07]AOF87328.1 putative lipoprotein [Hydrogenophaga sp. RAC07]
MSLQNFWRLPLAATLLALLTACAHPIGISPLETPVRNEAGLNPKKVAYVMTDADRGKEVITAGGGGDKVSYFPYRDLEKSIRDALRAVYSDVFVVKSASDREAIATFGVTHVFSPSITTTTESPSLFTWPPTKFGIDLTCEVSDAEGKAVTTVKAQGNGTAEFAEFKSDFGLAGRRAAAQLSEQLKQQVQANAKLR